RVIVKRCQSKYIDQKYAFYEPFIWSLLNNENIHPFLGIVTTFDESVSTVAEWVDGKDAYTYVQDPKADPSSLLLGLARALHYLHSHPHGQIIHGDVQGSNVLVADNNRAWLTNFSCSVMRSVNMTLIPCNVGDFRWRAPEHVKAGVGISAAGDVWAFGMTILELFSANPPFQGEPSEPSLCDRIQQGLLPQRPTRMTDKWWKLCTSCWKLDATSRPSMSTLVGKTKEITA
ncbi:kinase-like domain-containing protein, partial [Scleroderma citrinum]